MDDKLLRMAVAMAMGSFAGWAAARAGMPLPWMLGPMIVLTILATANAPIAAPMPLRPFVVPVIGVMLGSRIDAQVLSAAGQWGLTLALLVPFMIIAAAGAFLYYRAIAKFDPITAFFAAMPGGLADMVLMGEAAGGDERRIALAHASRVLLVVLFVGSFFGFALDIRSGAGNGAYVPISQLSLADALWLSLAAALGAFLGRRLRLPAGPLFGPMLLSGALHVTGLVTLPPPTLLVNFAQIVLGTVIGCRFLNTPARMVAMNVGYAVGATLIMLCITVAFAALVARLTGVQIAQAFLAYSPGGLTEMSLLALAMGAEVAYVSVAHVARIALVIFGAPLAFRLLGIRQAPADQPIRSDA